MMWRLSCFLFEGPSPIVHAARDRLKLANVTALGSQCYPDALGVTDGRCLPCETPGLVALVIYSDTAASLLAAIVAARRR